ncbi:efflux transporter outer membrane subunit [Paraglaciecola aquimarina]|uniref:Efflux transporter outer membrane subunit n=1 Tax=Paraglaciecola aquimarina TaxID=1235557 RepID=A0ABU3SY90_9ALTE|nr:efflux transporter outer membrane subunit [Paraglaciecola aquimarina]MDU0354947.1 efflux transporter outer membrane subunit [Paraglaciecola aquimarina]
MKVTLYFPFLIGFAVLGCATDSQIADATRSPEVPTNWQLQQSQLAVNDNWLAEFKQPILAKLVHEALTSNRTLRQAAYDTEILEQRLVQSGAAFWPTLDLKLTSGRSQNANTDVTANSHSIELNAGYEIDIWGKLSNAEQQANLIYLANKAQYQQSRLTLVADVVTNWFNLVTSKQLQSLAKRRVENARQNLDIIESGYKQGLNGALDVYLSRNELNSELSNLADQHTSLLQNARNLEKILSRYPSGAIVSSAAQAELPLLDWAIPTGLPSDVMTRKPALQASWYQVLALDAAVAFAHKQRFPSINLNAAISDNSNELSDLLSGSSIAWSILGSITAPLFRAGDLKANEEISRLQLKQQEQLYVDTLYNAFAEVENGMTLEDSLKQSYQATLNASQNARQAETLSFEQYQKGLVNYTTVLEAQGRSFDAQSALIQLKNKLLANRVALYVALGGDFSEPQNNQEDELINE